jgi:hypothetical protein
MSEGCRVITLIHQRMTENAMAEEWAREGVRLGERQEVVACSSAAAIAPQAKVETQSPKSTERFP